MRAVYNLLLWLALPFLPLRLWWRGRKEPGYRKHVEERFGRYHHFPERPVIWLHAVSLGETRAAQPLVKAIQAAYPDHLLLVTHMTATGRGAAEELFPGAMVAYLPYDYPFAVRSFLDHFRPWIGVLMETEVWPNLIAEAKRAGVPIVLANARMSEKSARGYRKLGGFTRETFGRIDAIGAQTDADAGRLGALGAKNVKVVGNIKYDVAAPPEAEAMAHTFRGWFGERPVLLLASTREGEEAPILDALGRYPIEGALVVLVPRHPHRFEDVAQMLERRGLKFARRSAEGAVPMKVGYLLGDSMGEMAAYYRACDVAFVGGSLVPVGGQNLIEACAAGAPVLVGPSTFNFAEAARLAINDGAALRVQTADEMVRTAGRLLADPAERQRMAAAGRAFAAEHRGATERMMGIIEKVLGGG